MKLKNEIYDVLKWVSCICVPALVVFLGTVLGVLDIDPKTVNIITTIVGAIGVFIGALIRVSTSAYNKQKGEDSNGKDNSNP